MKQEMKRLAELATVKNEEEHSKLTGGQDSASYTQLNPSRLRLPEPNTSSTASQAVLSSSNTFKPFTKTDGPVYMNDAANLLQKISDEKVSLASIRLADSLQQQLQAINQKINKLRAAFHTKTASKYDHIDTLLICSQDVYKFIVEVFNQSDVAHVKKGLHQIFEMLITITKSLSSDDELLVAIGFLIGAIFQLLSPNQRQQLSWRFQAMLFSEESMCIPSSSAGTNHAMVTLQMILLSVDSAVMDAHYGWRWLLHACQLYRSLEEDRHVSPDKNDTKESIEKIVHAISTCLKHAGLTIYRVYHQHMVDLLQQLRSIIKKAYPTTSTMPSKLSSILDYLDAISHPRKAVSGMTYIVFCEMDFYIFHSILAYRLDEVINTGIYIDEMKSKPDDIKEKLVHYRINRLQGQLYPLLYDCNSSHCVLYCRDVQSPEHGTNQARTIRE
jgi:hypothetical protein